MQKFTQKKILRLLNQKELETAGLKIVSRL